MNLERKLTALTKGLVDVILEKNLAYGNSVFDPVNIFSRGDAISLLEMQIDHKLSRIARGKSAGEDTRKDLISYLLLLEVAIQEREANAQESRIHLDRDADRNAAAVHGSVMSDRRSSVRKRPRHRSDRS